MRVGRRIHHWDDPMPTSPLRQRHFSPSAGDNVHAIRASAGHPFDLNVTYASKLRDGIDHKPGLNLAAHYAYPWLNGYRYWHGVDGKGRRQKVPVSRRHWSYDKWGMRGLHLERANGEHTLTLNQALEVSAKVGAIPIKETKSRAFATSDRPWQNLNRDCERNDVPNWSKTLVSMWGFKSKVVRAAKNGVPLAAIYGKGIRGRARRVAHTVALTRGWTDGTKVYATW